MTLGSGGAMNVHFSSKIGFAVTIIGFGIFSIGYWRGIRASRRGDFIANVALILIGVVSAVIGGIWFIVGPR
jgi:hypothetical protein